jgi:hypothetical protein
MVYRVYLLRLLGAAAIRLLVLARLPTGLLPYSVYIVLATERLSSDNAAVA